MNDSGPDCSLRITFSVWIESVEEIGKAPRFMNVTRKRAGKKIPSVQLYLRSLRASRKGEASPEKAAETAVRKALRGTKSKFKLPEHA